MTDCAIRRSRCHHATCVAGCCAEQSIRDTPEDQLSGGALRYPIVIDEILIVLHGRQRVVVTRVLGERYLQTSCEILRLSYSFLSEDIPKDDISTGEVINVAGTTHSVPNLFPISSVCRVPKV